MSTETLSIISIIISAVTITVPLLAWIFKYGVLHSDVKSMQKNLSMHQKKIDKLAEDVAELKGSFKTYQLIKSDSPIKLTEGGVSLLEQSGGKAYLDKNIGSLYKEFEKIDNEYDIQKKAREIIKDKEHDQNFDAMKKYLYQKGLSFSDLAIVMGVYLRDLVLEKKEIQPIQREQVVGDK